MFQDEAVSGVGALRDIEAGSVDVGDEQLQADDPLSGLGDAKLRRLLQRVGGVGAGIGERHDLGARTLSLQQRRREIGRRHRQLHAAQDRAAGLADKPPCVGFELRADRVIRRDEEPAVPPSAIIGCVATLASA